MPQSKSRITLALGLTVATLLGCSARIPERMRPMPGLVRAGELDTSHFAGRNDPTLHIDARPMFRATPRATQEIRDRQWISSGRPYSDFRVTTTSRESRR
ncbi:MAG: hypothetical protein RL136_714 [Planctomycetota bacterium]